MTPPAPTRDTPAGRTYNDLRNLAHRHGRDPSEYFTLYALEGFLSRLAESDHVGDFVLKGGVLMAAFAARRPTRDIDLAASGVGNDIADVVGRVQAIVSRDIGDGLTFDLASIKGERIRDDADFAGVRVKAVASLVSARLALHVDVNFGDPIWPSPAEAVLPLLLGGTLKLPGYPDHMVLAEKIVTAIDRGDQNTRWRDFADIAAISSVRRIRHSDQRRAIEEVANFRRVTLEPLRPLLSEMPGLAQRKWAVWRRKQRLETSTPERFVDLLDQCLAFADPVLDDSTEGLVWSPAERVWEAGEPGS